MTAPAITELDLLRGFAEAHALMRDTEDDMRRANASQDLMRRGLLRRQMLLHREQRDSLFGLWRRQFAGRGDVSVARVRDGTPA